MSVAAIRGGMGAVTWLFVVVAIAVVAVAFLLSLGLLGELPPPERDLRPDELNGEAVFDVVVRGYRMDEVDQRISALEGEIEHLRGERAAVSSIPEVDDDVPS